MVKKYNNRLSVGFTDQQINWLCDSVRLGFAEDIAGSLRRLVNEKMGSVEKEGKQK